MNTGITPSMTPDLTRYASPGDVVAFTIYETAGVARVTLHYSADYVRRGGCESRGWQRNHHCDEYAFRSVDGARKAARRAFPSATERFPAAVAR